MAEILVAPQQFCGRCSEYFSVQIHKFGFSSTEISALRWIFAAVIMFVLVLVTDRKKLKIKLKDVWMFAGGHILLYADLDILFYQYGTHLGGGCQRPYVCVTGVGFDNVADFL